jgi:gliding motility-associated-like protein
VQVTDQCAQSISTTIPLLLETPPILTLPSLIARGCAPLTVQMPSNLTTQPVTYNWQFGNGMSSGATAPSVTYQQPGTYTVSLTVTTPMGCTASAENTGQVIVMAGPQVSMEANPWTTDIDHGTIEFTAQHGTGIVSTQWMFGDGGTSNAINPAHTYTTIGTFNVVLQVQDVNGCTNTAEGLVHITPVYDIHVPNAFTPNLNGGGSGSYHPLDLSNDIFYPFVRFVDDYRMRIFNRWGELIFETNDLKRGWDGYYRDKLSPQDVYVYQLWVRFVDGREKTRMGDITLMR